MHLINPTYYYLNEKREREKEEEKKNKHIYV